MIAKAFFGTVIAVSLLSLTLATAVYSQATDGNIVGNVIDSSRAAVPHARVEVTNIATGVMAQVTSDGAGFYRAVNLLVGTYKVTIQASGFAPAVVDGVTVTLNLSTTVNVTLSVGTASSAVAVTAAAALVDTSTAQITNSYSTQSIQGLPSAANPNGGANGGVTGVINLALLGAGVTSSGGIGLGIGPSVGGQRPPNNSFNIEGADNNRKDVTGPVASVPPETIAEFTIIQNQFSAEYGHSIGGQFNTVLVNGANAVHGVLWEYLENRDLNAIDQAFARQYVGQALPPNPRYDQNRLGAMIGGPIRKNKLFYFGSYEYNPIGQNAIPSSASYSPTAAGYALLADIPAVNQTLLGVLKQYAAAAPVASGSTAVAGVTIPIGILPIVAPNFQNTYRWIASADYNLSSDDQLRVRYVDNKTSSIDTSANLPSFYTPEATTSHLVSLSEFHNFSPAVINEFRAAYNRYDNNTVVPNFKFPGLDVFPNIGIDSDLNLNIGPDPSAPQAVIQGTYQLVDNLTWVKGRHELKFGVDARDLMLASTFIQRQRGDYEYTTAAAGTSLDLFLTDQFPDDLAQRNVGARPYSGNLTQYYAFANDNWKVTPHLTLNLGIRYEFNGVAQSMRLFNADAIADTPGVLAFQAPTPQRTNFAPRLGFAYSPGKNGASSLRGGFGIAYDQVFDDIGFNATPPQASATVNANPTDYPNGGFLANGGITPNTVAASLTPEEARADSSSYLPALQKQGYAITWNLGYQRVFAKNYTLEVRYVGTKGVHLLEQDQLNRMALVTPTNSLPIYYSAPSAATLNSLANGICPLGGAADAANCITVGSNQNNLNNPLAQYGYTSTITEFAALGNSWYHGLATQLNKRFAAHLLFQAAYTWSHTIDDGATPVNTTTLSPRRAENFGNLSAEKASSGLDHRQRFVLSSIYEFPGFGKNRIAHNLLAMRFGVIYTYETGELVTPQSASDANLNGDSAGDRVVINTNGVPGTSSAVTALKNSHGATVAYLATNPTGYYVQALAGVYANSGRNILATPPIDNLDFNVSKLFSFRERMKFELRGDFYNGLNHPQYTTGSVNTANYAEHVGETNYLTPGNPLFAQWSQVFSSQPRVVQVGVKLTF